MDTFPLIPLSNLVASCMSNHLSLYTAFTMVQMQHKEAHDLYHSRKYLLLYQKASCNTYSQPMYATIESEVFKHLIRTLADNKYQSCK